MTSLCARSPTLCRELAEQTSAVDLEKKARDEAEAKKQQVAERERRREEQRRQREAVSYQGGGRGQDLTLAWCPSNLCHNTA